MSGIMDFLPLVSGIVTASLIVKKQAKDMKGVGTDGEVLSQLVDRVQKVVDHASTELDTKRLSKPSSMEALKGLRASMDKAQGVVEKLAMKSAIARFFNAGDYLAKLKSVTMEISNNLNTFQAALGIEQHGDLKKTMESLATDLKNVQLKSMRNYQAQTAQILEQMQQMQMVISNATSRGVTEEEELRMQTQMRSAVLEALQQAGIVENAALLSRKEAEDIKIALQEEMTQLRADKMEAEEKYLSQIIALLSAVSVPSAFVCPISRSIMRDPVILGTTGHTFEREQIERHLSMSNINPNTNLRVDSKVLAPNYSLRETIDTWLAEHGLTYDEADRLAAGPLAVASSSCHNGNSGSSGNYGSFGNLHSFSRSTSAATVLEPPSTPSPQKASMASAPSLPKPGDTGGGRSRLSPFGSAPVGDLGAPQDSSKLVFAAGSASSSLSPMTPAAPASGLSKLSPFVSAAGTTSDFAALRASHEQVGKSSSSQVWQVQDASTAKQPVTAIKAQHSGLTPAQMALLGDQLLNVCNEPKQDITAVQELLNQGADPNATTDSDKYRLTPLHWAAINGHVALVSMLLRAGADVERPDRDGSTPLHYAIRAGQVDAIKVLLEAGADVQAVEAVSNDTPLRSAVRWKHEDVVRVLLQAGASVEGHEARNTPLQVAARDGQAEMVRALLQAGANKEAVDGEGKTPLHHAASRNLREVVSVLLAAGANKEAADRLGATPLHLASESGHLDVVYELLRGGANKERINQDGLTATTLARKCGHSDVATLLRTVSGAKPGGKDW